MTAPQTTAAAERTIRQALIDLFGPEAPEQVYDDSGILDFPCLEAPRLMSTRGTGSLQISCGGSVIASFGSPWGRNMRGRAYLVIDTRDRERWQAAQRLGEKPAGSCPHERLSLEVTS